MCAIETSKLKLFLLTTFSIFVSPGGATKHCTINLCLLFSFGSKTNGCKQTIKQNVIFFFKLIRGQ